MASSTAMFTSLSGLTASAQWLDVIGNNVANVNTTAFKNSRMLFATNPSRTLSVGSPPDENIGGTNPKQIGLGVQVAGIQKNMSSGTIQSTGDLRDLAIEGNGFFVVQRSSEQLYTRAGAFRRDAENNLTNIDGDYVLGYGVDGNFNVVEGELERINIPIGTLTLAQATDTVRMSGNLNAGGSVSTQGSLIEMLGDTDTGLSLIPGATMPATPPAILETTSLLTEIEDPLQPGSGATLFAAGQTLEVSGAEIGGMLLPTSQFLIEATSTVADLMAFLNLAMGVQQTSAPNPDGRTPGTSLDPDTGIISITGNIGEANDLGLTASDVRLLDANGALVRLPFVPEKEASADGEGVRTTYVVYDSLGATVAVDVSMAMVSKGASGTTWQYFLESGDSTDGMFALGTGFLEFDTNGQLLTTDPVTVQVDRSGTGAASPLVFEMYFSGGEDNVTALVSNDSTLAATYRDGSPMGTLTNYGIGPDGIISGVFSNGIVRTLGQVALASFTNPEGLLDKGSNVFQEGPNSGTPVVTEPGSFGTGLISPGSLELSNVDLGQEFTNMILASTGYAANSRVMRTCDELMQQLLVLGR